MYTVYKYDVKLTNRNDYGLKSNNKQTRSNEWDEEVKDKEEEAAAVDNRQAHTPNDGEHNIPDQTESIDHFVAIVSLSLSIRWTRLAFSDVVSLCVYWQKLHASRMCDVRALLPHGLCIHCSLNAMYL